MNEVSFVGVQPSDAIRDYATKKIEALAREPSMRSCRVVLEAHRHAHLGQRFRAKYEVETLHTRVVVGAHGEPFSDPYAAIDAGYDEAKRALRDDASRQRDERRRA